MAAIFLLFGQRRNEREEGALQWIHPAGAVCESGRMHDLTVALIERNKIGELRRRHVVIAVMHEHRVIWLERVLVHDLPVEWKILAHEARHRNHVRDVVVFAFRLEL